MWGQPPSAVGRSEAPQARCGQSAIGLEPSDTQAPRSLMISRNRLFPSFCLQHLPIFQQFPCVLVIEIPLIRSHQKMPAPSECAALQSENALRLSTDGAMFRMRIVPVIRETLEILLRSPRILIAIFAAPVHRRFLMCFIPLDRPIPGPGESFTLDVGALLQR